MKKIFIYLFAVTCLCGTAQNAFSQANITNGQNSCIQVQSGINDFINNYFKYTNEHNVNEISKMYADNFVSGDGLKRDDVLKLTKETWNSYPDIKSNSVIKDIRVNDQYATVETMDKSYGNSLKKSDMTGDTGNLESESHNILYLQKFGKGWKIISDKAIYEKTTIKFGSAKPLKIALIAPEQVLAGETYTASLNTDIPNGMVALGSITREPIVYPQTNPDELYRQVSSYDGVLERVMKSNTTNNNELATASVGYTEIIENILSSKLEVKLTGMAIVLTRVNVIPANKFVPQNNKLKIETDVDTDGIIDKTDKNDLNE